MSLVNDMLRDLEQRRAGPAQPLRGLHAVAAIPQPARRRWARGGIALATCALVAAAAVVARPQIVANARTPMLPATVVAAAIGSGGAGQPSRVVTTPVAVEEAAAPIESKPPETAATDPLTSPVKRPLRLSYALSPLSRQPVRRVTARRQPAGAGERRATATLRESRRFATGAAAAAATLAPPAAHAVAVPQVETSLTKVATDPAQNLRSDGLSALRSGRPAAAAALFRRLIVLDPARNEAHLLLYQSLLALDRNAEAHAALVDALAVSAQPTRIAVVLAHRLMAEDDADGARRVLETFRPTGATDIDYEALLAAAYERSGDNARAREQYGLLSTAQPQRGAWWVGLGIACEGLGLAEEAAAAFLRARDTALEPALQRYALERLASLEPQP